MEEYEDEQEEEEQTQKRYDLLFQNIYIKNVFTHTNVLLPGTYFFIEFLLELNDKPVFH